MRIQQKKALSSLVFFIPALVAGIFLLQSAPRADALSGWKAGNIIDDAVMTNKSAMSVSQIQSFLNSKVPNCDTNGTQISEYGGPDLNGDGKVQRWEWGKSKYNQTKFPCLKDYNQNGKSSAQIIYNAAQQYSINPQVLLVLLEKEQALVKDTWPLNVQYRSATGYGCPDTAACDSKYYGLENQIKWAATMFRAILDDSPSWYTPYELGNNYIQYNPSSSCGGSTVYIENRSTQALYNYTPYQPNKAALDAGTGSAPCGAYGNRNFFIYFNDWFGSTQGGIVVSSISFESQPFTNKQTRAVISIKNTSKTTINLGRIKIEARGGNNAYYQTPSIDNLSIKSGATYTFKQPITISEEGNFTFTVARNTNNTWVSPPFSDFGIGDSTQKTALVTMEPTVTQSLTLPEGNQHINAPITATFKIKNNSNTQAVNIGRIKIQGNLNGTQYDFPSTENNLTILAGQTYTYSKQFTPTKLGNYNFTIISNRSDYGWKTDFPKSLNSSIARSSTLTVNDSVTVTQPLVLSASNTRQGEDISATFSMRNFSTKSVNIGRMKVQGTHSDGSQYDFPSTPENLVLQPGATYTYNESIAPSKTGSYTFKIMNFREKERWSASYPMNEEASMKRSGAVRVDNATTVIQGLQFSHSSIHQNEPITATFAVKNHSNKTIDIGRTKVECKSGTNQFDFDSTIDNLTIAAGATYEYTSTKSFSRTGTWSCKLVNFRQSQGWSTNFPASENVNIARLKEVTIR